MTEQKEGKLLLHPSWMRVGIHCYVCRRQGEVSIYSRFYESFQSVIFFCEKCRLLRPNAENVDSSACPELKDQYIFPTGAISWYSDKIKEPYESN